jgi:hypothetical protein
MTICLKSKRENKIKKKLIVGSCCSVKTGLGNKKTNIDPFASITKEVDSIRRVAESIHCDESPERTATYTGR